MKNKRKKPTLKQRLTPCISCQYPISQQHHTFSIAKYRGEILTVPLCANCHELYHTLHNFYHLKSRHAANVLKHLLSVEDETITHSILVMGSAVLVLAKVITVEDYQAFTIEERVVSMFKFMPELFGVNDDQ